jgi:hypothetical protein
MKPAEKPAVKKDFAGSERVQTGRVFGKIGREGLGGSGNTGWDLDWRRGGGGGMKGSKGEKKKTTIKDFSRGARDTYKF